MPPYLLQILIFLKIYTFVFFALKTIVTVFTRASKGAFFAAGTFLFFVVVDFNAIENTVGVPKTCINTIIHFGFGCTKVLWTKIPYL